MRIGIQTWGSHGDIRPFIALAEGLQQVGHQVSLLITCVDSTAYAGGTSASGADIAVIASPVIEAAEAEEVGLAVLAARDPMRQVDVIFKRCFAPAEDRMFAAARQLCEGSDLLIGHYIMHPLQVAAQHANKPYVSVMLSHAGVPSAFNHPLGRFGRTGNRALWWLTRLMLSRTLLHYANRLRRQLDMAPVRDVVNEVWLSQALTLVAVSPQICARQPDWPETVQVCGFLDMPNIGVEGVVPAELEAFLAGGEPPVYMTVGSWTPPDIANQRDLLQALTDAAHEAGCRAIIQGPAWRECGFAPSEQILYVGAAPHHLIFPRCCAVLHHGGAGTTQSATLAGKPSIVMAFISEQEHWGSELRRLGIAGKVAKVRNGSPAALAQRIRTVRESPQMSERAARIGAAMREERGVAAAVALIGERFR